MPPHGRGLRGFVNPKPITSSISTHRTQGAAGGGGGGLVQGEFALRSCDPTKDCLQALLGPKLRTRDQPFVQRGGEETRASFGVSSYRASGPRVQGLGAHSVQGCNVWDVGPHDRLAAGRSSPPNSKTSQLIGLRGSGLGFRALNLTRY